MDYTKFSNLESYIFNEVKERYTQRGYLTPLEFFSIVIWKSNRAKSKIARKFDNFKSLEIGVKTISNEIYIAKSDKERLRILIIEYKFLLPMASAILSVLYPSSFSIYDYRVCDKLEEVLNTDKYKRIKNWHFEKLWMGYTEYLNMIILISEKETYRSADKFLWGKSFYDQLQEDLKNGFLSKISGTI